MAALQLSHLGLAAAAGDGGALSVAVAPGIMHDDVEAAPRFRRLVVGPYRVGA